MENFLIRSDVNSIGKAASIFADAQHRQLEITHWANLFTEAELQPLATWLENYHRTQSAFLTVVLRNAWSSFPYMPPEQMRYEALYTYYENTPFSPIARILSQMPLFDLRIEPSNPNTAPKIVTDVSFGFIQITGNSFTSLHIETYQPFFAWLEKYLQQPGRQIRIEFWFDYFNSSSSKSILEILDVLAAYQRDTQGQINAYWYYQEYDTDMEQEGLEMRDDSGLPIRLIALEQAQWKQMSAIV